MIEIKPITQEEDIYQLWKQGFSKVDPEWSKYNAPYFEEYTAYTFESFVKGETFYKNTEANWGIFVKGQCVGVVSRYWEDKKTRWIEVGIVIYDEKYWDTGIGSHALTLW